MDAAKRFQKSKNAQQRFDNRVKEIVKEDTWVFPHKCEEEGCDEIVQFDDEPKCFTHSPNEGSNVMGYSARAKAAEAAAAKEA